MWTLSGFIDEISDDFNEQCKVAADLGLRYVEVRSAWQINILDLDAGQLESLRRTLSDGSVVVAGAGDGEVPETVRALRDDGFDGFFSLEPHLGEYTAFGALSGPKLFTKSWQAFTDILNAEGIAYA